MRNADPRCANNPSDSAPREWSGHSGNLATDSNLWEMRHEVRDFRPCTSLLRPGRFFVSRAFTRYTSKPVCSRMSYTAIQYTQWIASRRSVSCIVLAKRPSPLARRWCTRTRVPAGCLGLVVPKRSGIRCRYQCPRHRDGAPPDRGLRSVSSASFPAVACGSSRLNGAALDGWRLFCFSPLAWVSC